MTAKIYQGDVGTAIVVDIGADTTAATSYMFYVKNPGGALKEWTPTPYETTKLRYVTVEGDLSVVGVYKLQVYVEFPDWKGRSETVEFTVNKPFE